MNEIYTIGLNVVKPGNYAFYDYETNLHLTRDHLKDNVRRLSNTIINGLASGTLIDIGKNIDQTLYMSDRELKLYNQRKQAQELKQQQMQQAIQQANQQSQVPPTQPQTEQVGTEEQSAPAKRGRKPKEQ